MSYSSELSRRLRKKEPIGGSRAVRQWPVKTAGTPLPQVVPPHPQKYPKHEGSKGSVFGGECNRTLCDRHGATYFNRGTRGYYCASCADGIDWQRRLPRICIPVGRDLNHAEMDELYNY